MTNEQLLLLSFVFSIGSAALCAWFADRKGRSVPGWALGGFLIGVIALVVLVFLPSRRGPRTPRPPI